jgi:hypothetical protein
MTWLAATEYLCHKWPRICSVYRYHSPVRSLFMTYHRIYNKYNTTVALMEQELFKNVPLISSVFCVVFCWLLFVVSSFFFWSLFCLSFDLWFLFQTHLKVTDYCLWSSLSSVDVSQHCIAAMIKVYSETNVIGNSFNKHTNALNQHWGGK